MRKTHKSRFFGFALLAATTSLRAADPTARIILPFDDHWQFSGIVNADLQAQSPAFADATWRTLNLPHDWSIEGQIDPANRSSAAGAFLPAGVGWYRKHFTLPPLPPPPPPLPTNASSSSSTASCRTAPSGSTAKKPATAPMVTPPSATTLPTTSTPPATTFSPCALTTPSNPPPAGTPAAASTATSASLSPIPFTSNHGPPSSPPPK